MANEGSTKPTYSELEAENLRVRGLLQRQWISVEERLPEPSIVFVYWVGVEGGRGWSYGEGMATDFYDGKHWSNNAGEYSKVTHWQPLPDPPTFRQSSSLVSQGAESADIGKLDSADKSGKVNRVEEESVAIAFGWQNFVAGKTIQCAYDTGEWAVIQFTDGTKLEIVSSAFHMIEAARQ